MAKGEPLVSIIIPAYNAERTIGGCLDSAAAQTTDSLEVIVIDDGSTDCTAHIVDDYAEGDCRIMRVSQANSGVACARNKGIKLASGRYLMFLDADDELPPESLSALIETIETHHASLAFGSFEEFTETGRSWRVDEFPSDWMGTTRRGREVLPLFLGHAKPSPSGSAWRVIFDTASLRNIGARFPVGIRMGEDYCFMLEVLSADPVIAITDAVVYRYRQSVSSVTSNYISSLRNDMAFGNDAILRICRDEERLMPYYYDCVATTCMRDAQNELRNPAASQRRKRCAEVFAIPAYSEAIGKLNMKSTLGAARVCFLKIAKLFPPIAVDSFLARKAFRDWWRRGPGN